MIRELVLQWLSIVRTFNTIQVLMIIQVCFTTRVLISSIELVLVLDVQKMPSKSKIKRKWVKKKSSNKFKQKLNNEKWRHARAFMYLFKDAYSCYLEQIHQRKALFTSYLRMFFFFIILSELLLLQISNIFPKWGQIK